LTLVKGAGVDGFTVVNDAGGTEIETKIGSTSKTISTTYAVGYTPDGVYKTISIATSGSIGGFGVYYGGKQSTSIVNAGTIDGTVRLPVEFGNTGGLYLKGDYSYVTNTASASIMGGEFGVGVAYGGTVVNAGSITGTANFGIDLPQGDSSVINAA
jgi:hypothetical protein